MPNELLPEFEFADDVGDLSSIDDKPVVRQQEPVVTKVEEVPTDDVDVNIDVSEQISTSASQPSDNASKDIDSILKGDPNLVSAYKAYIDKGYLEAPDKEIEVTPEILSQKLEEHVDNRVELGLDMLFGRSPEFGQALVNTVIEKGQDLTVADIDSLLTQLRPDTTTQEDLNDEQKAYDYMVKLYTKEYGDSEQASALADVLKDKGTVVPTAKQMHKKLEDSKSSKAKQIVEDSRTSRTMTKEKKREYHNNLAKAINDTGWRTDQKDAITQMFLSKQFANRLNTAIYEDPNMMVKLINMMRFYDPEKKTFDERKFFSEATSSQSNKIKETLQRNYWAESSGSSKGINVGTDAEQYEFTD